MVINITIVISMVILIMTNISIMKTVDQTSQMWLSNVIITPHKCDYQTSQMRLSNVIIRPGKCENMKKVDGWVEQSCIQEEEAGTEILNIKYKI